MIKSIKISGFNLFDNPTVLDLTPDSKCKVLEENIIHISNTKRFLKTSVIYGNNNSGKSSYINAVKAFRDIVIDGKATDFSMIRNLPYTGTNEEIHFEINFLAKSKDIVYGIKFKELAIIGEYLIVNEKMYYKKDLNGLTTELDDEINLTKMANVESDKVYCTYVANNITTNSHIPVACNLVIDMFKSFVFIDNNTTHPIYSDLIEFYNSNSKKELLNKILKLSDINIDSLDILSYSDAKVIYPDYINLNDINSIYYPNKDLNNYRVIIDAHRITSTNNNGMIKNTPSLVYESSGVIKYINLVMKILDALLNEQTVFIDSIENNIKHSLVNSLIELMQSEGNKKSQFILTTLDERIPNLDTLRNEQVNILKDRSFIKFDTEDIIDIKDEDISFSSLVNDILDIQK